MVSVDPNPSSSEHPVSVPSYSRWFSYKKISECEYRMVPELSKNPRVYKYLRNSIVRRYRLNPTIPLYFSQVRKSLVGDIRRVFDGGGSSLPKKRPRLTPLADTSNPIMAQAAFLSALAGKEFAEAAARAAVATLTDIECGASKTVPSNPKQQDASNVTNGNSDLSTLERASLEANSLLEREEMDMEQSISSIMQVQMKEIQEKLVRFEKLDLQMEKEWQQFEQQKNLLFVDQLTLLFNNRSSATDPRDPKDEIVRTD